MSDGGGTDGRLARGARLPFTLAGAALEFLTPVRLTGSTSLPAAAIGRSSALFPFIGLLLGLVLIGIDRVVTIVFPPAVVDALLVTALATVTGALHFDGLADTADGLFGGHSRQRRLEIMRDSRIGSFGALAVALVVLLQWTALLVLAPPWRRPGLLLFPVLGRSAMVCALAAFPYAREEGLGTLFRRYVWPWPLLVAELSAFAAAIVCFGGSGAALWGASLLVPIVLGAGISALLGGLTGDSYGAICEITQVVVLLLIDSAHQTGWLLPWLIRG